MRQINIQAIPAQEFTVNIGNYRYDIRIFLIETGFMAYDFSIDQAPVIQGQLIVPGQLMLPYAYQEKDGNFFLFVPNEEDPSYLEFGKSQLLYYLDASETAEVRSRGN